MHVSGSYRRKGGSGAGRLWLAAVGLGLTAFLGSGCAGTSPPPRGDHNNFRPSENGTVPFTAPQPLPIDGDGNPRGRVQTVGWTAESTPAKRTGGLGSPSNGADAESYHLPSLQLATDGPIARFVLPTNEGPWSPDQAVLPWVEFHDDLVTVHNIRNCDYRTVDDYTVRLYAKTFDLRKLTSVDLIVVPFNDNPSIAHVALSFGFEDRDFVVSSVEIRKRVGQQYSAMAGFFNQYTLMYVLADERDVIWKETTGFQSEVYIYRTKATPRQAQEMFVDVMGRVNKLVREPEFYNTITNNCTTNVRNHVNHLLPDRVPYDYRVLLPGYAPELAYDLGLIEKKGTFAETKAAAKVNFNAYFYADDPEFSRRIRGK